MKEDHKKESNGSKALIELSDEISGNDKLLSNLYEKLKSVTVSACCEIAPDVSSQEEEEEEPPCSSLVGEIKCFKNRLKRQNERLNFLLETIDI